MSYALSRASHEAIANTSLGALRLAVDLPTRGLLLAVYSAVSNLSGLGPTEALPQWTVWAVSVVGYDFAYYWAHRAQHRIGVLWAFHAVHHQATRFNPTVGLRVAALNSLAGFPFFLPLAALGVPVVVFAGVTAVHALLMAWLHTTRVPALPVLESFLNTPALHRVHHSRHSEHADRNFGGVFILWDRLFGTYGPAAPVRAMGIVGETEAPGILGANLVPWRPLWVALVSANSSLARAGVLFGGHDAPPVAHRSRHILLVLIALFVICAGLFLNPVRASDFLWLAPTALLAADLVSGIAHWFMDRHADSFGGLLRRAAREFVDHHAHPARCLSVSSFRSAAGGAAIALMVGVAVLLVVDDHRAVTLVMLVLLVLIGSAEIHKCAHDPLRSRTAALLQSMKLLITHEAHHRHHAADRAAYCVVTGWCNPLLDRFRVWHRLDAIVERF